MESKLHRSQRQVAYSLVFLCTAGAALSLWLPGLLGGK